MRSSYLPSRHTQGLIASSRLPSAGDLTPQSDSIVVISSDDDDDEDQDNYIITPRRPVARDVSMLGSGDLPNSVTALDSEESEDDIRPRRRLFQGRHPSVQSSRTSSSPASEDGLREGRRQTSLSASEPRTAPLSSSVSAVAPSSDDNLSSDDDAFGALPASDSFSFHQAEASFKKKLGAISDKTDIELLYPRCLWPHLETDKAGDEIAILQQLSDTHRDLPFDGASESESDFEELSLTDFALYRDIDHKQHPGKLESLHTMAIDRDRFCVSGKIHHDEQTELVHHLEICSVSIGNYGDRSMCTTQEHIWVQTFDSRRRGDVWYKLINPAPEYKIIWESSQWLADFAKHFLDFLAESSDDTIILDSFKTEFIETLTRWHGGRPEFQDWHLQCDNLIDFRKHLARFAEFLKNQACNITQDASDDSECPIFKHTVWWEICVGLRTSDPYWELPEDEEGNVSSGKDLEDTVVTPNVAECFTKSFPAWGPSGLNILKATEYAQSTSEYRQQRMQDEGLPNKLAYFQDLNFQLHNQQYLTLSSLELERVAQNGFTRPVLDVDLTMKVVICRRHDEKANTTYQYALVMGMKEGGTRLRLCWLTLPSHASPIKKAFYPIGNELFISNDCNCEMIRKLDVLAVYNATLWKDHAEPLATFFIRERLHSRGDTIVYGRNTTLLCNCKRTGRSLSDTTLAAQLPMPPPNFAPRTKMRGLSLFSGCGLLDWGMEDSGLLETKMAVEMNKFALRTHAVNNSSKSCKCIYASVNKVLVDLLRGRSALQTFDYIVAGSPCKGFSKLNQHRTKEKALRQQSLVALTLSFVEIYMPKLFVMENVPDIDGPGTPNVCHQALAFLVALGYQVQTWLLNSSDFGSVQKRKRLFIVACVPGFPVPERPRPTHGPGLLRHTTVAEVMGHLPSMFNDLLANIKHPDHVPLVRLKCNKSNIDELSLVHHIPKVPHGMNLYRSWNLLKPHEKAWVPSLDREQFNERSSCLKRIDPDESFPTLVTKISPFWGRAQPSVHWRDDRIFSLEEARLVMGCPNSKVLVGSLTEQLQQLGNGVPFQMARAVGQSVAQAWRQSSYQQHLDAIESDFVIEIPN